MRFAVLGLYNSGSSALAGMLHRLGANLGPPFWRDRPGHQSHVYEADDLARELRRWWDEPRLMEQVTAPDRIAYLQQWIVRQEACDPAPSGAKHPLLSLCAADVRVAWGADTRFIWARRPLADSVAGLVRRGWFPSREEAIQQQLWEAIERFGRSDTELVAFDWAEVRHDPQQAAERLARWTGLAPNPARLSAAAAFVRSA